MNPQQAVNTASPTLFLRVERLRKEFGDFVALDSVSLDVFEGEFVCLLGPSGCGKTTFLRAISGLDIQTSGSVHQVGKDISALPPSQRDFGIVFQSYALFPNLTIAKNIAFGLENQKRSKSDIARRVRELLELVNLADQAEKYPAQLSGGEQQRVALSRALATSPGLLLLDEPLSALDAKVRAHLRHQMKALQRRLGVTTIMVTHDQEEALTMADRIVVMNCGRIEQVGTPTEIYRQPHTLFVANFIGAMNQVVGRAISDNSVAVGDLTLATRHYHCRADEAVAVTIRPEDIIPHAQQVAKTAATATTDRTTRFDGMVESMEFLGSFWRVTLSNHALGKVTLMADISINAMRRINIAIGESMTVQLPAERILVFPDGDSNR